MRSVHDIFTDSLYERLTAQGVCGVVLVPQADALQIHITFIAGLTPVRFTLTRQWSGFDWSSFKNIDIELQNLSEEIIFIRSQFL